MASWFSRFLQKGPKIEPAQRIRLSTARFRHLLRQYGEMIRIGEDAADKQSGEYILDKQYIVALSDKAFETTEGILYDLNILTDQMSAGLYTIVEDLRERIRMLVTPGSLPSPAMSEENEEPEYRLLRAVREALFRADNAAAFQDNEPSNPTLFDIVQSAQEAAGDSLTGLIRVLGPPQPAAPGRADGFPPFPSVAVDLMSCLNAPSNPLQICDAQSVNSFPLREFLTAFSRPEFWQEMPDHRAASESARLVGIGLEDSSSVTIFHKGGYMLADACIGCTPELNHIYCRFAAEPQSAAEPSASAILAAEIFKRLGFSAARTRRGVTGWSASESMMDTTLKLQAIGGMAAYLFPPSNTGVQPGEIESRVDRFFQIHD